VHLIDYEWVFEGSIPVNFALFRAFRSLHHPERLPVDRYFTQTELKLYQAMEKRLVYFEIMPAGAFYQYRERYQKNRNNIYSHISSLNDEITKLHHTVEKKDEEIVALREKTDLLVNEAVFYASSKSWKITRPMRKTLTYLRGKTNESL
jgi:hypothetical protein